MKGSGIAFILLLIFCIGCSDDDLFDPNAVRTPPDIRTTTVFADVDLNEEAQNLYIRLQSATQQGIAFGQQEPFGTGNDFPVLNQLDKDFQEVTGDFPAIAGFDLELIGLQADVPSEDIGLNNFIRRFTEAVVTAHENGSIITISWHMVNPNSVQLGGDGNFNGVVSRMLEGGDLRLVFLDYLQRAANLLNGLVDTNGNPIPVLFRPWHEMNGDFFFWGEGFRSTEAYVQLWRDTVTILSEDLEVHNLIYVYAPNWVPNRSEYLRNYPGDEYVDMLGVDVYDFSNGNFLQSALSNLQIVEDIAREKNMLFALTETGLENVTQNDWWTQSLYRTIRSSSISYAMVWRNDSTDFFHVPFVGHPSENDFRAFLEEESILLGNDLPD